MSPWTSTVLMCLIPWIGSIAGIASNRWDIAVSLGIVAAYLTCLAVVLRRQGLIR